MKNVRDATLGVDQAAPHGVTLGMARRQTSRSQSPACSVRIFCACLRIKTLRRMVDGDIECALAIKTILGMWPSTHILTHPIESSKKYKGSCRSGRAGELALGVLKAVGSANFRGGLTALHEEDARVDEDERHLDHHHQSTVLSPANAARSDCLYCGLLACANSLRPKQICLTASLAARIGAAQGRQC
eukprot:2157483-Prymnesium_polylepis.3